MILEKNQIVSILRKILEKYKLHDLYFIPEIVVPSPNGYPILEAIGAEEKYLLRNLAYTPTKKAVRTLFHHPNFKNYILSLAPILAKNPHTLDQHKTWLRRNIFMSTTSRKQERETVLHSPRVPPDWKIELEPQPKKSSPSKTETTEKVLGIPNLRDKIASFFGGRRRTRRRRRLQTRSTR